MLASGWRQSVLQGIGTRFEVMAELYPRLYLLLTTVLALTGFGCLLLFPLLALAGVAGVVQSLANAPEIAWLQLPLWLLVSVSGGWVSWHIMQFRPRQPRGVVLERNKAPDLFELIEDAVEQYAGPGIDRVLITSAYQLDIVKTPRTALPLWSTRTLLIGLPLMQCLSMQQFGCLLARRLGQFSRRTNPLLNRLFELRDIWSGYRVTALDIDPGYLPVHLIFSVYAPLYTLVSTAAARLDELQADSYAMELYSDEEVLEAITTDTVYRLFQHEKYWPAIRKLGPQEVAAIAKTHSGMRKVLHAGLQPGTIAQWIEKAMTMEQQWNDTWPLLARRLDNIGHAHARMHAPASESAAEDCLPATEQALTAALVEHLPEDNPCIRTRPVLMAVMKQKLQSAFHSLRVLKPGSEHSFP